MMKIQRPLSWIAALGTAGVALGVGGATFTSGCDRTPKPSSEESSKKEGAAMTILVLQSEAIASDKPIPRKYTGDAEDVSPPLAWSGVPDGTKELAMIMDDPDAPRADPWVHWVIYKIPANAPGLPEGLATTERVSSPSGALQGANSWDRIGYGGPYPPKGHGVHHYHFKLYALDRELDLKPGATKAALLKAMQGHILGEGELIGTYER